MNDAQPQIALGQALEEWLDFPTKGATIIEKFNEGDVTCRVAENRRVQIVKKVLFKCNDNGLRLGCEPVLVLGPLLV